MNAPRFAIHLILVLLLSRWLCSVAVAQDPSLADGLEINKQLNVSEWRQQYPDDESRIESLRTLVEGLERATREQDFDYSGFISSFQFISLACFNLGRSDDPTERTSNHLTEFALLARTLGVSQQVEPVRPLEAGLPSVEEFVLLHEDRWAELFPLELIQAWAAGLDRHDNPLKPALIEDPDLRDEATRVMQIHLYGRHWRGVWVSFERIRSVVISNMETVIKRASNDRGLSRREFYQTRLAMFELVVKHCPDEDLVKRLFPTGVVPPSLTDAFEGREQIEEREAALMERLEVDSAKRETERAERLEQMIELWDQARREAAAGDQRHGGGR